MIFQVCREWEATALGVNKNVRVALIRIGVVLGKEGGALGMEKILIIRFNLSLYFQLFSISVENTFILVIVLFKGYHSRPFVIFLKIVVLLCYKDYFF